MLAWGIVAALCLAFLFREFFLRRKIRALQSDCAHLTVSLEKAAQALDEQTSLAAGRLEDKLTLTAALAEKEAALAEKDAALAALTAPAKPKLYLPDKDAAESEQQPLVYYNENTGIYHADRACAPYGAIELPLAQVPSQARPCKKCAEGMLPVPPLPPDQPDEEESQLSLFDGAETQ